MVLNGQKKDCKRSGLMEDDIENKTKGAKKFGMFENGITLD